MLAQINIALGPNASVQVSGMLLYGLLSAIAIGIWRVAVILTDMRNDLNGSKRIDKIHGRRLDDHANRLNALDNKQENVRTDDLDD
jgi:hypothetical protein